MAPCSSRKSKSLTIENVATQLIEVSKDHSFGEKKFKVNGSSLIVNLVKLENSKVFDGFSTRNAQVGSELLHKDSGTTRKREAQFLRQKNKGVQSDPVPSVKEESRRSGKLIQVKCFKNIMQMK